jgi:hypothetical protein
LIEEGLYKFLQANAPIQATLAPNTTNNIFMGVVPESASYPCILFRVVSAKYDTTFDGPSGYCERRYEFIALGKEDPSLPGSGYVSAKRVGDIMRQQMNGLTGTLPDGTLLFNSILDTDMDIYDEQGMTHNFIQDYFLQFRQNP